MIKLTRFLLLTTIVLYGTVAFASPTFYGNSSPTGNRAAWNAAVLGLGGTVNSSINFDSHPVGVLQPGFYSGVTLTPTGDSDTVVFGTGPGQGNTSSTPLSAGEGTHLASNFLSDGGNASSLMISFSSGVFGFGLHVIDYFNPSGNNPLTLSVYDGVDGTGNLLGTMSSVAFNFQPNNMYFMGVTNNVANIRSVVFSDVNSVTGDTTGIDDLVYAESTTVPEPTSLVLIASGLAFLVAKRKAVV